MVSASLSGARPRRVSFRRSGPIAAALLLVAVLLGVAVRASAGTTWLDSAFAAAVSHLRRPWLDETMMALSGFGDALPRWCVTILVSAYLAMTSRYRWAFALVAAMGASALLAPALKLAFHTPRPSPLYAGVDAFSFPSGHAASAAVLYIILGVVAAEGLSRCWRLSVLGLAVTVVALIGLSRVYLGAHWLSDVLAGVALGSAIATVAVTFGRDVGKGKASAPRWRDGLAILACLAVSVAGVGPPALAKAHRLYAPFLDQERPPLSRSH